MELNVKKCLLFPHCLFFLVFKRDINISADFTRILASNTAIDDVTN